MATELETTWISRTFLSRNRSFRWKGPSLFRQVVVFAKSGALRKGKRKTECPTLHIVLGMAKTMFEPLRSWCPFCTEASMILQSHGVMDLKAVSWWETVSRTWETPCISRFVVSFSDQVVEADHRSDELEFMNTLKGMTELKVSSSLNWQMEVGMKLWLGQISWQLCLQRVPTYVFKLVYRRSLHDKAW